MFSTTDPSLLALLERIPNEPGVYLMKDAQGKVLYVGKAQHLRQRVRSYFSLASRDERWFVRLLEHLVADIETVVTHNEKEALLLENTLIKKHKPRFNVRLRDDKNYLVLRLNIQTPYPRLEVVRQMYKDGARYFGPYDSASSCRQTLQVINRHFKLRTCTDAVMNSRSRPCLQYQIKRCDAPCVFPIPPEQYAEQARDVSLFLQGKNEELLHELRTRMQQAAEALQFEIAAALRDQIQSLEKTLEEQRVVSAHFVDQDVFGWYRHQDELEFAVLHIRQGKLMGRRTYHFANQEFPDEEALSSFVNLYYDLGNQIPDEVLLPCLLEDHQTKAEWLTELRQQTATTRKQVQVLTPQRGPKHELIVLANKNAAAAYQSEKHHTQDITARLAKLQARLGLRKPPARIECVDISHWQGTETVASLVVFINGEPARHLYRRYKLRANQNDDFASMYEIISRRARRAKEAESGSDWVWPDLLVIDGGKGQLASALAALKDAEVSADTLDVIGLAKEREEEGGTRQPDRVFLPKTKDPIKLRPNTAEMFVLARIRDEAHRFAVAYHTQRRTRRTLRSQLAEVPGIGSQRQKVLLRAFGSVENIRSATPEQLAEVPGISMSLAKILLNALGGKHALDAVEEVEPVAYNAAEQELGLEEQEQARDV